MKKRTEEKRRTEKGVRAIGERVARLEREIELLAYGDRLKRLFVRLTRLESR